MRPDTVRTSLDIPRDLHRRVREIAAKKGCSARQLILQSIEQAVANSGDARQRRRLSLDVPIVPSTGKPFTLTNEQIHDVIEFP